MGSVWLARHLELGRAVALKLVLLEQGADVGLLQRRFEVEAQAIAQLTHPAIVRIFEAGVSEGVPWMALELVEGGATLATRLAREGPLAPRDAARVCAELAEAMDFVHSRGVLHRDLKPANVLIDPGGRVRITDFGVALIQEAARARLTATGEALGTPSYMAPEQADSAKQAGARADVYALGAILYALLSGRPPFQGANPVNVLFAVFNDPPPPLPGEVPPGLARVCRWCLEKEPGARPASAGELAEALRGWLAEGEPGRGLPWSWAAAGVVAAGLALAGVGLATRGPGPAPTPSPRPSERLDPVAEQLGALAPLAPGEAAARLARQALITAREALEGDPQRADALELLQRAHQLLGEPERELEVLEQRIALAPSPALLLRRAELLPGEEGERARCEAGELALSRGDAAQAAEIAAGLAERGRGALAYRLWAAPELWWSEDEALAKRAARARAALEPALEQGLKPIHLLVKNTRGRNVEILGMEEALARALRNGDPNQARLALRWLSIKHRKRRQLAEALDYAERYLREYPSLPEGYDLRARALEEAGQLAGAARDLRRAVALAERTGEPQAGAWGSHLGLLLSQIDRLPEALAALEHALTLHSKPWEVIHRRATILARAGKVEASRESLRAAIERMGLHLQELRAAGASRHQVSEALRWSAARRADLGDTAGALSELDAAIRLSQRPWEPLDQRAGVLARAGQAQAARQGLRAAVARIGPYLRKLTSRHPLALLPERDKMRGPIGQAYAWRSSRLLELGDLRAALADAEAGLAYFSRLRDGLELACELHHRLGDAAQAERRLREFAQVFPQERERIERLRRLLSGKE